MAAPQSLSVSEIRNYMIANGGKVTNHALVKHFKRFLTGDPDAQNEARKKFKTFVNILVTIKNENNQKYLILRKKYANECPTEETIQRALENIPNSPSGGSLNLDSSNNMASSSPRQPPPYKPPPEVVSKPLSATTVPPPLPLATGVSVHKDNIETYGECVQEFSAHLRGLGHRQQSVEMDSNENASRSLQPTEAQVSKADEEIELRGQSVSRTNSVDMTNGNKENIPRFSFSSGASGTSTISVDSSGNGGEKPNQSDVENENPMSVKEATRKFNRMASEEEAKVMSPPPKKKPETSVADTQDEHPVNYNHVKVKEWIVSMAKCNYQELAKLLKEYPELLKLPDPSTGYTALHWAAKHGNEDVVKLVAGTHKCNVNARTNGGYTPLHLAVQFNRIDIFELLCNVYKANRDIMDWSGNKPLDYTKQQTSVSASTYSKIKARRKHNVERDLSFLRIGSLNVRVKKTTEAFSNFLGVGNGNGVATMPLPAHHQMHARRSHHVHASKTSSTPLGVGGNNKMAARSSQPVSSGKFDNVHKSWGSADNIPQHSGDAGNNDTNMMPPPKSGESAKKRHKSGKRGSVTSSATDSPRHSISSSNSSNNLYSGYSSMPTTPNQLRSPLRAVGTVDSDSDSACGFGSNWSVGEERNTEKL